MNWRRSNLSKRQDSPAVSTPPEAVRAGADGAYIVLMDRYGSEIASVLYEGSWDLGEGFTNAYTIRMISTEAGKVVGAATFASRTGTLMGFGEVEGVEVFSPETTITFPPGGFRIVPERFAEPAPGSWQEAAMRAIEVPRKALRTTSVP